LKDLPTSIPHDVKSYEIKELLSILAQETRLQTGPGKHFFPVITPASSVVGLALANALSLNSILEGIDYMLFQIMPWTL